MILTARRGQVFTESFNFKNAKGKLIAAPAGDYILTLEHGAYVTQTRLPAQRAGVVWQLSKNEVEALPYSNFYFSLTYNGAEIARGVLRVE